MFEMSKTPRRLLLSLLLIVCACAARAAEEAGDGKDHPMLSRMPGYTVYEKAVREYDAVSLNRDTVQGDIVDATYPLVYEGRITFIKYGDSKNATSKFAIYRNYAEAIRLLGGRQLNTGFERSSSGVYGRDHVFEIQAKNGPPTVVLLKISVTGEYYLTIIEPKAMTQDVKVGSLALDIETKGVATLYMNFDENKSDLKADGVEVVSQIVALMAGDPTLKLSIEGHTDNVGSEASNKKLSADRAQSVMRAVVAKGVAPTRLSAKGFGAEVAAADNRTEEGRAKNRRVELVKVK